MTNQAPKDCKLWFKQMLCTVFIAVADTSLETSLKPYLDAFRGDSSQFQEIVYVNTQSQQIPTSCEQCVLLYRSRMRDRTYTRIIDRTFRKILAMKPPSNVKFKSAYDLHDRNYRQKEGSDQLGVFFQNTLAYCVREYYIPTSKTLYLTVRAANVDSKIMICLGLLGNSQSRFIVLQEADILLSGLQSELLQFNALNQMQIVIHTSAEDPAFTPHNIPAISICSRMNTEPGALLSAWRNGNFDLKQKLRKWTRNNCVVSRQRRLHCMLHVDKANLHNESAPYSLCVSVLDCKKTDGIPYTFADASDNSIHYV